MLRIVPIPSVLGCLVMGLALATTPAIATAAPDLFDEFSTLDTSDNGLVTSTEFQAYARKLFDEIDADADEKLTVDEIMASEAKFNRYVSTADVNGGAADLTTKERAQRIDADQDGLVSRSEHADAAALKFKSMDKNGDGELGFMEFEPGG